MNERDKTLLRDMLDMSRKAQTFLDNKTLDALDQDEILTFALVRAIELIGEAASKITPETRGSLPQIPWKSVVGMRNKIIHDYKSVDYRIVWKTITDDLPPLVVELEKILPPEESEQL